MCGRGAAAGPPAGCPSTATSWLDCLRRAAEAHGVQITSFAALPPASSGTSTAPCTATAPSWQLGTALLLIDVQRDFLPGGALPVQPGDAVVPALAPLLDAYPVIVATQDAHPPGHVSFASTHAQRLRGGPAHAPAGTEPPQLPLRYTRSGRLLGFQVLFGPQLATDDCAEAAGTTAVVQQLWPDHCVRGSPGAELEPRLAQLLGCADAPGPPSPPPRPPSPATAAQQREVAGEAAAGALPSSCRSGSVIECAPLRPGVELLRLSKGCAPHMDAYSAFYCNGRVGDTGLHGALRARGITSVHVAGLALDVCVMATARPGYAPPRARM